MKSSMFFVLSVFVVFMAYTTMRTTGQNLLFPLRPTLYDNDNITCTGVVSNIFRRQLRRILICTKQLNLKSGHQCALKCAMIMEGVLTKEGKIEKKLLEKFAEKFPDFMQQRVDAYTERCRVLVEGKINPKEDSCRTYEPLSRCIIDAIFNVCGQQPV